jgi:hypothetical protein
MRTLAWRMDEKQKAIKFIEQLIRLHADRASTLVDENTVQFLRDLGADLHATPTEEFEALRAQRPKIRG